MKCPNCGSKQPERITRFFLWVALSAFALNQLMQFNYWLLETMR